MFMNPLSRISQAKDYYGCSIAFDCIHCVLEGLSFHYAIWANDEEQAQLLAGCLVGSRKAGRVFLARSVWCVLVRSTCAYSRYLSSTMCRHIYSYHESSRRISKHLGRVERKIAALLVHDLDSDNQEVQALIFPTLICHITEKYQLQNSPKCIHKISRFPHQFRPS